MNNDRSPTTRWEDTIDTVLWWLGGPGRILCKLGLHRWRRWKAPDPLRYCARHCGALRR